VVGPYLPALPPGTYQIRFGLPGYQTQLFNGVKVSAGKPTTLDVVLKWS
jgi:Carboxypeptidase regulatory-like domain